MTGPDLNSFIEAIHRVAPAVNIRPSSLSFDPGFIGRARRRPPWMCTLVGVRKLLVYVGALPEADPEQAVRPAVTSALAALTDTVRGACEQLVVVWDAPGGAVYAAACSVSPRRELDRLLGTSWTDPVSWADPMFDASRSLDDVLETALRRIRQVCAADADDDTHGEALERALKAVDAALLSAGGEGQHVSDRNRLSASQELRSAWLARYESSVRDEWHRVRGSLAAARVRAATPTSRGPLSGLRVFLSYARPDAAELARPILQALRAQGADVWFDQEEALEEDWLDRGLAATIEDCDAYVLCASDEFFGRAGYATQEVAWAVHAWQGDSALRSMTVVARSGTLLPTVARQWPLIVSQSHDEREIGAWLANAIRAGLARPPGVATASSSRGSDASVPPLAPYADPAQLLSRVRHRERLFDVPLNTVVRIVESNERDAGRRNVVHRLRRIGAGLDWDGHLVGFDGWPADPVVRVYRWMLGTMRAVAGVRWPLSGSLEDRDDIAGDIELVATRRFPALEWPTSVCWGDEERRLLIRYQMSLLRVLEELLDKGAWAGLLDVAGPVVDQWQSQAVQRRRECLDALVDLRLAGGLSWRADPPIWDRLYDDWRGAFAFGPVIAEAPGELGLALGGDGDVVAALAAQVTWLATRRAGCAVQSVDGGSAAAPIRWTAWATTNRDDEPVPVGQGRRVILGLVEDHDGAWTVRTTWRGFAAADGSTTVPAPGPLAQVMKVAKV